MDNSTFEYMPDYVVTPGDVIENYLGDLGMTTFDLALKASVSVNTIDAILAAEAPITSEIASQLEKVLGRPKHFWLNLEKRFQEDFARTGCLQKRHQYQESV